MGVEISTDEKGVSGTLGTIFVADSGGELPVLGNILFLGRVSIINDRKGSCAYWGSGIVLFGEKARVDEVEALGVAELTFDQAWVDSCLDFQAVPWLTDESGFADAESVLHIFKVLFPISVPKICVPLVSALVVLVVGVKYQDIWDQLYRDGVFFASSITGTSSENDDGV